MLPFQWYRLLYSSTVLVQETCITTASETFISHGCTVVLCSCIFVHKLNISFVFGLNFDSKKMHVLTLPLVFWSMKGVPRKCKACTITPSDTRWYCFCIHCHDTFRIADYYLLNFSLFCITAVVVFITAFNHLSIFSIFFRNRWWEPEDDPWYDLDNHPPLCYPGYFSGR